MSVSPPAPQWGDLNDQLIATDWWTDQMVQSAGIPIVDVPFVSIGGGIGSFVTVDYLRIAGVPTDQIRVLTNILEVGYVKPLVCAQARDDERIRDGKQSKVLRECEFVRVKEHDRLVRQRRKLRVHAGYHICDLAMQLVLLARSQRDLQQDDLSRCNLVHMFEHMIILYAYFTAVLGVFFEKPLER